MVTGRNFLSDIIQILLNKPTKSLKTVFIFLYIKQKNMLSISQYISLRLNKQPLMVIATLSCYFLFLLVRGKVQSAGDDSFKPFYFFFLRIRYIDLRANIL